MTQIWTNFLVEEANVFVLSQQPVGRHTTHFHRLPGEGSPENWHGG